MVLELSLKRGRQAGNCENNDCKDSLETYVENIVVTLSQVAEKRRLQVIKYVTMLVAYSFAIRQKLRPHRIRPFISHNIGTR